MNMKRTIQAFGAVVAMLVFAGSAHAATINEGLTSGVLNTLEDQDREAYFDVDNSGTLSVGDVFVGFVRIDDFGPSGLDSDNQVYGVISNQIIGFDAADPTIIHLGTTTQVGLRLEDITGDATTAGGMIAVYDTKTAGGFGNLISSPTGSDMEDNTTLISSSGTLRLVLGLANLAVGGDYLMVDNGPLYGIGSSNQDFDTLLTSVTVGSFSGGMSVLYNNTNFTYAPTVVTTDAYGAVHLTQIGIGSGAIRGAAGATGESIFIDGSGYAFKDQCSSDGTPNGANEFCGFTTDADFFANPERIPEPATLSLFGAALLGLGFMRP